MDLSCDVDFAALAEAALGESPGVEVHGPVEQGAWLQVMGVRERAAMIGGEGQSGGPNPIMQAVERLIERGGGSGGGMGRIYKVMAVVPESGGRRKPVGFGGGVEE